MLFKKWKCKFKLAYQIDPKMFLNEMLTLAKFRIPEQVYVLATYTKQKDTYELLLVWKFDRTLFSHEKHASFSKWSLTSLANLASSLGAVLAYEASAN